MTRRLMLRAIRDVQEGRDPPQVVRRPEDNHFPDMVTVGQMVPAGVDHREFWRSDRVAAVAQGQAGANS